MIYEFIEESISNLLVFGSKREDLIIGYSPVIEYYILEELYLLSNITLRHSTKMFGVEINRYWPYNEIVVYDKIMASQHPSLILKLNIKNEYTNRLRKNTNPIS